MIPVTFFAVTRGKQITSCLGSEEAKYFLRWIYGPESFVCDGASEGVEGELGYYQGVDLALSWVHHSSQTSEEVLKGL